jgi:hypothetical protein
MNYVLCLWLVHIRSSLTSHFYGRPGLADFSENYGLIPGHQDQHRERDQTGPANDGAANIKAQDSESKGEPLLESLKKCSRSMLAVIKADTCATFQ